MSKELIEQLLSEWQRMHSDFAYRPAPKLITEAADRIEQLERENKRLSDDHYFQACLTRDLMPYQERAIKAEQKCDALQADNARLVEAITEGLDTYKVPRTARICEALAATPEQSLARLRNQVREECAAVLDDDSEFHAAAIRAMKEPE